MNEDSRNWVNLNSNRWKSFSETASSLLNLLSIVQLIPKKSQKHESFDSVDISVQKQLVINSL